MNVGEAVLTLLTQLDAEQRAAARRLLGVGERVAAAEQQRLLSIAEAADFLSVAQETVRRHLRDGRLPGRKVGGTWRIDFADLTEWGMNPSVSRRQSATRARERAGRTKPPRRVMADALTASEGRAV